MMHVKDTGEQILEQQEVDQVDNKSLKILDTLMLQTRILPSEQEYDIAKQGISAFINYLFQSENLDEPINKSLVDRMIVELDHKIGLQIDEILHAPKFQELESAWRGVKFLVDRTNFGENNKLSILHVTKEELLDDFEFAPEIGQSGLYKHVYSAGYGQFGGEPIGAIIGNYQFTPSNPDMKLLQYVAAVGAMAHAPFLSSVAPEFFGIDSFTDLANIKDLKSIFEGVRYTKWRALRELDDSRYLALSAPRFLLRVPYDPLDSPSKNFNYSEDVSDSHESYLWGNTAFALASRLSDSFSKYRWCPNIIGPQSGGMVDDLPLHWFEAMGELQAKISTEVLITDRKEFELAQEGFIGLTMRKGSDNAVFFSANSVQRPQIFDNTAEGKKAELNFRLGTQLPYMMIINRIAHYLKVLQREQLGSWKERQDLERELNIWIKQFVADQENPPADVRSRRPLRSALIVVSDVQGDPGWYQVSLSVRPHFKYMGANFELSLVGRLDQNN